MDHTPYTYSSCPPLSGLPSAFVSYAHEVGEMVLRPHELREQTFES